MYYAPYHVYKHNDNLHFTERQKNWRFIGVMRFAQIEAYKMTDVKLQPSNLTSEPKSVTTSLVRVGSHVTEKPNITVT